MYSLDVLPEDTSVADMLQNMSRHHLSIHNTCMHKMRVHDMRVRDMSMHNLVLCNTFMRKRVSMCTHVRILQVTQHTQWCNCRACTVV